MARLTFPKFDPTVTLDKNPVSDDPVVKRLTKIFKDAMVVRDRLHDAHAKALNIAGGHSWVAPKDPKVIKAMKDAKKDVDDARDELRQALKERGIDIAAQHQANTDLLKAMEIQSKEAMRKAGLGETLERLEHRNAPMNMKHLIERCEKEVLVEFDPMVLAGPAFVGAMGAMALAPAALSAMAKKERQDPNYDANHEAEVDCEVCKKSGRNCNYRCADGYHMNDNCFCRKIKVKGPSLSSRLKSIFSKKK
jgi:hypothetical protein